MCRGDTLYFKNRETQSGHFTLATQLSLAVEVATSLQLLFNNTLSYIPTGLNSLSPWVSAAKHLLNTQVLLPSPLELRQNESSTPTSFVSLLHTTTVPSEGPHEHWASPDGDIYCIHICE